MPADKIARNVVVSLQYRLSLDDGSLVEETEADDPLVYLHGHDNIIPGLEHALEGLQAGDRKTVVVEPADAYGEYDPDEIEEFERAEFPPEIVPQVGMLLEIEDDTGHEIARIIDVTDDTVTLDFNHPLAGARLHFEVTITGLRMATAEEIEHGHAHGPGSHHH